MRKYFFVSVLLLIVLAVSFSATSFVFAEERALQNDYDYSKEGDVSYKSVDIVGVLENIFGEQLSETERKYLLEKSDLNLKYSDTISVSNVKTEFENGKLRVEAYPYSYKTINARGASWTPVSVSGNNLANNEGVYTYLFDSPNEIVSDSVSVKYQADFQLNYKDINTYINYVYELGKSAKEKLDEKQREFEEAETQYNNDLQAYNEYVSAYNEYLESYEAYHDYQIEYALWQDKVNEYSKYLNDYKTYRNEVVLYENYLKELQVYNKEYQSYREYLSLLDIYNKELAIYNEQTKSDAAQTTIYQLSILHYLTKPVTSLNRTIYSAVMGDAVTRVLAEKEALVTVGKVEARAVDLAANATSALRRLLEQYNKYKNDDDRYVFYILCQEELSKNFNDLFRALDFLYNEYPIVRKVVNQMEKKEQFEILLAQLYCMCNALTNEKIPNYIMVYKGKNASGAGYFDENYKIGDGKRNAQTILGKDGVLEDKNNAIPLENGVPNLPEPPIKPEEVKMPTAPKKVNEPIKPDLVEHPGDAPKKVSQPVEPQKVDEPIIPERYVASESEIEISQAYELGVLKQRERFTENVFYRAETFVEKYFRNVKISTIYFFDGIDTNNLIYVLPEVELGSYVEFPLEYPKKTKRGYTCTFDGWTDENGNFVDLNRFNLDKSDVYLYPHFKETPNSYHVNWRIDAKTTYSDDCAYGSTPAFDSEKFGEIKKDNNGIREYRFIGWKKGEIFYDSTSVLEPMSDISVTYEAVFEESYIITFVISGIGKSYSFWEGDIPSYDIIPTKQMDSTFTYVFSGWNTPFEEVREDKTYVAVFEEIPLVELKYSSTKGATVSQKDNYYIADCRNSVSSEYVAYALFKVAVENGKGIIFELSGASVTFSPIIVNELAGKSISDLYIYFVNTGKNKYKYILRGYDSTGEEIYTGAAGIEINAYGAYDEENSFLYETTYENEFKDVRFSFDNDRIKFTAHLGSIYQIAPQNTLTSIPSEFLEITLSQPRATSGERIKVTLSEPPKGMYVESIYVDTDDGSEVFLDEDMTFIMPSCAVRVGAVCAYYEYTVTFKSDGKTISVRTYKYGDTVVEPTAVYKGSDDKYVYTFKGWDNEIKTVEGDAVYTAVYETAPLPKENIIPETTKLTKLLHLAYVLIPVIAVLLIGFIVIIVCVIVKKKKRKARNKSVLS